MRWIAFVVTCCSCANGFADGQQVFDSVVVARARALAAEPYQAPGDSELPPALEALDYEGYRDIRFRKDHALWSDQAAFSVEFFHPGFLYRHPVQVHEVVDGVPHLVTFDSAMFDYGKHGAIESLPEDLGFAGFRVHFPLHDARYKDELIAFLGASYFRMVGRGQHYGLSARGLAVNTAEASGEEFPTFTQFWLVRPEPQSNRMEMYALLESESVTGAYAFELQSQEDTILTVRSHLFARADISRLGVAPLTSMFAWGENQLRQVDDFRPEVHDSDGVIQHTGSDEWIWRPLVNPKALRVSALLDEQPRGYGLAQRDRDFASYQDPESRYNERPGFWVIPQAGDWGKGAVQLVEIPTADETNDNIVAFWVPDQPLKAGESRRFDYQLRTFDSLPNPDGLARVVGTRDGWGWIPGAAERPPKTVRQMVIDFEGRQLDGLAETQPVEAELQVRQGEARTVTVAKLPDQDVWRVAFKLFPEDGVDQVNIRLYLKLRGLRVSETWDYLWETPAVQS